MAFGSAVKLVISLPPLMVCLTLRPYGIASTGPENNRANIRRQNQSWPKCFRRIPGDKQRTRVREDPRHDTTRRKLNEFLCVSGFLVSSSSPSCSLFTSRAEGTEWQTHNLWSATFCWYIVINEYGRTAVVYDRPFLVARIQLGNDGTIDVCRPLIIICYGWPM